MLTRTYVIACRSDPRFTEILESASFFFRWTLSDVWRTGGKQAARHKTSLAKTTIKNLIISAFGFVEIARSVIDAHGSCVGNMINQNYLEHFFGKLRDHSGSDRTPTAYQALCIARTLEVCDSMTTRIKATANPGLADMPADEAQEQYNENVARMKAPLQRRAAAVDRPGQEQWSTLQDLTHEQARKIVEAQVKAVLEGTEIDALSDEEILKRSHFGRKLGKLANHDHVPTQQELGEVWELIKADMRTLPNNGPYRYTASLGVCGLDAGAVAVVKGLLAAWSNIRDFKVQRAKYEADGLEGAFWEGRGQTTTRIKNGLSEALQALMREPHRSDWEADLFAHTDAKKPTLTARVKRAMLYGLIIRLLFDVFMYDLHRDAILPEGERGAGNSDHRRCNALDQLGVNPATKQAIEIQDYLAGWVVKGCDIGRRGQSKETRFFVDAMDVDVKRKRDPHVAVVKLVQYLEGQLRYKYLNPTALWVRKSNVLRFACEELGASLQLRARWLLMLRELALPKEPAADEGGAAAVVAAEEAATARAEIYANSHDGLDLLHSLVMRYLRSKAPRFLADMESSLTAGTKATGANR